MGGRWRLRCRFLASRPGRWRYEFDSAGRKSLPMLTTQASHGAGAGLISELRSPRRPLGHIVPRLAVRCSKTAQAVTWLPLESYGRNDRTWSQIGAVGECRVQDQSWLGWLSSGAGQLQIDRGAVVRVQRVTAGQWITVARGRSIGNDVVSNQWRQEERDEVTLGTSDRRKGPEPGVGRCGQAEDRAAMATRSSDAVGVERVAGWPSPKGVAGHSGLGSHGSGSDSEHHGWNEQGVWQVASRRLARMASSARYQECPPVETAGSSPREQDLQQEEWRE